ncbi:hypothetical protein ACFXPI_03410 [Streptomyces sp. NPDC059104]|uniref:hypothetical protein n=1 Tax=Streptomyces sp. NPDC059104 TaxID=3346729 RepID=UPI0036ACA26F
MQPTDKARRAYSHSRFEFPGLMGEERTYVTGEAGLLTEGISPLPGFTAVSAQTHGDSRDTINLTIEARAERQRRSAEIIATFVYDPEHQQWESHPYGFRFVSARLTTRSRKLGHLDIADPTVTEHTDLHRLLDTLIIRLYGGHR